jgi:hypothetical protein
VVRNVWRDALPQNDDWSQEQTKAMMLKYEAFVKAMRKDLGVSNWGLAEGDLGRAVNSDWQESESRLCCRIALPGAEGVGFEPTVPVNPGQRFSRPPHSSALPPLREISGQDRRIGPRSVQEFMTPGGKAGPSGRGCR